MKDSPYFAQVELLIRAIPVISREKCFALKGGTAINLFLRDMPRLSIDIDLTYLPLEDRDTTLANIGASLQRIAKRLRQAIPGTSVSETRTGASPFPAKLVVRGPAGQIKIEPNLVLRGTVHPPVERDLSPAAETVFEQAVSIRTLAMPDLYGGKLCAALDRQHARDLFDVMLLLDNEGITEQIRQAFLVYLASHSRPMHELLDFRPRDIRQDFERDFQGMARQAVTVEALEDARDRMRDTLLHDMTEDERFFLLSIKRGEPRWELLDFEGVDQLPGIRWKLWNIQAMRRDKHEKQLRRLEAVLNLS